MEPELVSNTSPSYFTVSNLTVAPPVQFSRGARLIRLPKVHVALDTHGLESELVPNTSPSDLTVSNQTAAPPSSALIRSQHEFAKVLIEQLDDGEEALLRRQDLSRHVRRLVQLLPRLCRFSLQISSWRDLG